MTLFTDNPFEKMMIQKPNGRRDNAPPVPYPSACTSCPYKGQSPCVGYCVKNLSLKTSKQTQLFKYDKIKRKGSIAYGEKNFV